MDTTRLDSYPRLATALTITFLLCGALLVLVLLSRISGHIVEFETEIQGEKIRTGAEAASLILTRSVEREWSGLGAIAGSSAASAPENLRRRLTAAAGASDSIRWAGFANLEGRIVAASKGIGEGTDVSGRSWFRAGLSGDTLERTALLQGGGADSFVQLTRPVRDDLGEVHGLMIYRLDMAWFGGLLRDSAKRLDVDVLLVDPSGEVLVDARADQSVGVPAGILAAVPRASKVRRMADPEGSAEVLIHIGVPAIVSGLMPHFSGRLVVIAPAGMAGGTFASFTQQVLLWIVGALAVATLVPIVMVAHFVRPVERLSKTAKALADGALEFPTERCYTRETAILSASLARLQTRLRRQAAAPRTPTATLRELPMRHQLKPVPTPVLHFRTQRKVPGPV